MFSISTSIAARVLSRCLKPAQISFSSHDKDTPLMTPHPAATCNWLAPRCVTAPQRRRSARSEITKRVILGVTQTHHIVLTLFHRYSPKRIFSTTVADCHTESRLRYGSRNAPPLCPPRPSLHARAGAAFAYRVPRRRDIFLCFHATLSVSMSSVIPPLTLPLI